MRALGIHEAVLVSGRLEVAARCLESRSFTLANRVDVKTVWTCRHVTQVESDENAASCLPEGSFTDCLASAIRDDCPCAGRRRWRRDRRLSERRESSEQNQGRNRHHCFHS
jgi:hypothetical protein